MADTVQSWNEKIIEEFRANGGEVSTANFGLSLILLHHTGARTGEKRINPLRSLFDGEGTWLVVASAQGADSHPHWYHNVMAHPEVCIEAPGRGTVSVRAEVLAGTERDKAWAAFTAAYPMFLQYQQETTRIFPVIVLRRPE